MAENRPHCAETFSHAFDASRQIDYQGCTPNSASGSGQCGTWSFFRAFKAHQFGNARNNSFDDCKRGFGSDVAGGKSGSSSSDNELEAIVGCGSKPSLDGNAVIGKNFNGANFETNLVQKAASFRAGKVFTFSL